MNRHRSTTVRQDPDSSLSMREVFVRWWPLGLSWLLMAVALPATNAVIARLPEARTQLAAWGSIVLPISLVVEAPVIMMLAASTALCDSKSSYDRLWRFMMGLGAVLTVIHGIIAFTPLFDVVVGSWMNAPERMKRPARIGLCIMTPWTWAIAHRRFFQGILIRFGCPKSVGVGTLVRMTVITVILGIGWWAGSSSGMVVGASANVAGAVIEMVFIRAWVQQVLTEQGYTMEATAGEGAPMSWMKLARFYVPLSLTSILTMAVEPVIGAGLLRLPRPVDSAAIWPVTRGLLFVMYSTGMAYKEVVVSLLDRINPVPALRRFTFILFGIVTGLLLLTAASPLSTFWFYTFTGLERELVPLARESLWFGVLIPGLIAVYNWYQGVVVYNERTWPVIESMVLFLIILLLSVGGGILLDTVAGLYVALTAYTIGRLVQVLWLWFRSRDIIRRLLYRKE